MLIHWSASLTWLALSDGWVIVMSCQSPWAGCELAAIPHRWTWDPRPRWFWNLPGADHSTGQRGRVRNINKRPGGARNLFDSISLETGVQITDRFGSVSSDGAPTKSAAQADRGPSQSASQLRDRMPCIKQSLDPGVGLCGVHLASRRQVFGGELNGQHSSGSFRPDSMGRCGRFPQYSADGAFGDFGDLDDLVEPESVLP